MAHLYIGTFSGGLMPGAPGVGLHVAEFDEAQGSFRLVQTIENPRAPSYLTRHPKLPVLYAAEIAYEPDQRDLGGVGAYAIDTKTGELTFRQRRPLEIGGSSHVSLDPSGRTLFVASLRGGGLTEFPVGSDGTLGERLSVLKMSGKGPHPRQTAGMIHCAVTDPSGQFVYACNMGADRVEIYRFDPATGSLTPADVPYAQVSSGAGTRHVKFHPSLPVAYVTNEFDATVSVFRRALETGALIIIQTIDPAPDRSATQITCSEIVFNKDGSQVFVAVRGSEVLARYSIASDSGKLALIGHVGCGGASPMGLALAPGGGYLVVANRGSGTVAAIDISARTPRVKDNALEVASPTCVVF